MGACIPMQLPVVWVLPIPSGSLSFGTSPSPEGEALRTAPQQSLPCKGRWFCEAKPEGFYGSHRTVGSDY